MQVVVLMLVLAVGPVLDPLSGSVVTTADRELLPSGGSAASVADLWVLEMVSLRPSGGGLGLFDEPALSAYGWSWTEMRFRINDLDITDPARPGTPLFEVPHQLWQEMRLQSLWTSAPTLTFRLSAGAPHEQARLHAGWGRDVGGGTWVPRGFMDREPALAWGASPERRALRSGMEATADVATPLFRVAAEQIEHAEVYPTLTDVAGASLTDDASRTTVLLAFDLPLFDRTVHAAAGWQRLSRRYAGAEDRHPEALTLQQHSDAFMGQLAATLFTSDRLEIDAAAGAAYRAESLTPNTRAALAWDIEDEWTLLHRPRFGEELDRYRLDATLHATLGADKLVFLGATAARRALASRAEIPGGATLLTYERAREPQNRSVSVTEYDSAGTAREAFTDVRLEAGANPTLGPVRLALVAALDYASAAASRGPGIEHLTPAGGVAARVALGASELFVALRREPLALTAQASQFIDPARPRSATYEWNDDGDLALEPGEVGSLLARDGGDTHVVDPNLARPTSNQLVLGWRAPQLGPLRFVISGVVHALLDGYAVRLAGPAAASYAEGTVGDFATPGDARLEAADYGETVYARTPGTEGQEQYVLTNTDRTAYFAGAELQLGVDEPAWFVTLGATGYYSLGETAFGVFADRNDTGIIDSASADPNHQVNAFGSVDSGRAYHIKLAAGVRPLEGLSAALVLRYRDGEPMTRMMVVEDLPQGPTAVMALSRGNPVPRFTFHMTLDCRIRYRYPLDPWWVAVVLDGYNLLGSGTEINEDLRTGQAYRTSLEMMPGRAFLLSAEIGWM